MYWTGVSFLQKYCNIARSFPLYQIFNCISCSINCYGNYYCCCSNISSDQNGASESAMQTEAVFCCIGLWFVFLAQSRHTALRHFKVARMSGTYRGIITAPETTCRSTGGAQQWHGQSKTQHFYAESIILSIFMTLSQHVLNFHCLCTQSCFCIPHCLPSRTPPNTLEYSATLLLLMAFSRAEEPALTYSLGTACLFFPQCKKSTVERKKIFTLLPSSSEKIMR